MLCVETRRANERHHGRLIHLVYHTCILAAGARVGRQKIHSSAWWKVTLYLCLCLSFPRFAYAYSLAITARSPSLPRSLAIAAYSLAALARYASLPIITSAYAYSLAFH